MASTEQAFQYVLSFIVGKDQGREFPLPPDLHIVIGRISDVDLLLLDEGVSRKHAKISSHGGKIVIADLGSTNGTFVNGERVLFTELKAGDEIGIGTSKIKLVSLDGAVAQLPSLPLEPSRYEVALPMETTPPIIAGSIREMPLTDLLQLFSYSRKSGVLTVRSGQAVGKIYISDGQVRSAGIEDNPAVDPHKVFYRIFAWADGVFDLRPLAGRAVAEDIPETTTSLVLEATRQLDEIRLLESKLPRRGARLAVAKPPPGNLLDLAAEKVQILQLVLNHDSLEAVIDHYPGTDLEAYTCLLDLIQHGFAAVK